MCALRDVPSDGPYFPACLHRHIVPLAGTRQRLAATEPRVTLPTQPSAPALTRRSIATGAVPTYANSP